MVSSLYEGQVRQLETALHRHTRRQADASKRAATLEREVVDLRRHERTTTSDVTRRSYEGRAASKQRDLLRATDEVARAARDVADTQERLTLARRRLSDARATEQRRQAEKEQRERQQREQRERREQDHHDRREQEAARNRARQDAARAHELNILRHRTNELERQLAEVARQAAAPEITVLFLGASPEDQTPLRLDKETRAIQKEFRSSEYREAIWFEWRLARQLSDLIQDLNEVQPDVLHFSGHGSNAELAFEDPNGLSVPLGNDQLQRLLEASPKPIRLVLFNSCDSATQAELACNHVDVAIGMDSGIGDDAAKTFAARFYNSLGFGLSVADAFRQSRLQLDLVHHTEEGIPRLFARQGVDPETVVLVNPGRTA